MKREKEIKKSLLALLILMIGAPLWAKYPQNPHWKPKKKTAANSEHPLSLPVKFSGAGWDPAVAKAIQSLIDRDGKNSPRYNPQKPPIATLPWENVFLDGDASELVFWRLIRRADFKFSDAFWNIVPITYGRQKIRAAYEQFSPLPKTIWKTQPTYHQYLKYFLKSYQDQCRETGLKACRTYLAQLWIGFSEKETDAYVNIVLNQEKFQKMKKEAVSEPPEDRSPVLIHRGIRIFPQMMDLATALHDAGFEIWILSADADPTLKTTLQWAHLPYAHAGGIQIPIDKKGLFTGKVTQPLPFWGGETEIVIYNTGRTPALSIGTWTYDREILRYGNGLKILIDQGNSDIKKIAVKKNWLIQPAFK